MSKRLEGKVAFVTGGARGIGAGIVRRLASEGAHVAFTYQQSAAGAEALAASIHLEGGRVKAYRADSSDTAALVAAIDEAAREFGRIDILVNNAAVLRLGTIEQLSLQDFDLTLAVNVRAIFVAAKAALPYMGEGGRIINIGSVNADRAPYPGAAAYAMSKSALKGMVQGMSRDLAPRGITVNNVQPGPVNTDMNPEDSDFGRALHDVMALKRHSSPAEIAGFVAYLASDEAGFITGASLNIDGGFAA
ncbi:SDR family oxidoreductase [Cupriavidus plantarum]|uniref:SDR family oxidoreductase n=1 Tax=Cupriavidus plantarum TaxID=942865 RepID=UPI0015C9594F|nr:SDR family oxidoreductase [Cupriavidus plantarum]NYI02742.1 3-oxoacyl-[acyl-carrier protein] reductase [Cupriavidus plantarum]